MRTALTLAFLCALVAPCGAAKHFSFVNGYPAGTTSRQVGVTSGVSAGAAKGRVPKVAKDAEEHVLTGKVSRIEDGDTLWITDAAWKRTRVRLVRIDAPERNQPFGVNASKMLNDLVLNRTVDVRWRLKDKDGAVLGTVFAKRDGKSVDVNLTMVLNGAAWHDKSADKALAHGGFGAQATSISKSYAAAEAAARKAKRGLWELPYPMSPAEWRAAHSERP